MVAISEMIHGLPHPTLSGGVFFLNHDTSEDNGITNLYQACGFDPNSDELARRFDLPMIEYLPCNLDPLCCGNILTEKLQPVKPFIPKRRCSITTLAEFTMQSERERMRLPLSIRKIPNHKLPATDLDWIG